MIDPSEQHNTQIPTPLARVLKRKRGQRLKKAQRRKLQQQFIDTFGHLGQGQAMTQLGLSRFTFYAWLRDPAFKARYEAKLATYTLTYESWADEEDEDDAGLSYWMHQPAWRLIQRMKINERMKARRGEPHNIWW